MNSKEIRNLMVRRVVPRLVLLVPVLWVGACDFLGPDDPSGPGTFVGTVYSPNGAEGSAILELTGGVGLGTVSPVGGEVLYEHLAQSTRIVVVLDDPGEIQFQLQTDDISVLPTVTVIQVADGANEVRPSVAEYSVSFSREKDSSEMGRGG